MDIEDALVLIFENTEEITDLVDQNIFPVFDPVHGDCESLCEIEPFYPCVTVTRIDQDDDACGDAYNNSTEVNLRIESRGLIKASLLIEKNPDLRNKAKDQITLVKNLHKEVKKVIKSYYAGGDMNGLNVPALHITADTRIESDLAPKISKDHKYLREVLEVAIGYDQQ